MIALSIIVPALNEAEGIAEALSALDPIRARGAEVIAVDGGSEDGTADLARPLCDRVLIAPRGRAAQMNAGAAVARGGVLLFLHADTRLPLDADRLVLSGLAHEACEWGRFDVRIAGRHPLLPLAARLMNLRSRLTGIATGDQALFVDRQAFVAVGGFEYSFDGGHRAVAAAQAPRPAFVPIRTRRYLRPALGNPRGFLYDPADVAAAPRVFSGGRSRPASAHLWLWPQGLLKRLRSPSWPRPRRLASPKPVCNRFSARKALPRCRPA